MEKETKLSIQIQPADMHQFLVRRNYTSFSGLFGLIISVAAVIYLLLTFRTNTPNRNVLLLLIGALFLVIQPIQLKLTAYQKVKLTPMFKEPLEYVLNDKGIKIQQKEEEAQIAWKDVRKVVETNKSIFVYTSPISAFIFPKNQYVAQYDAVKSIIKQHVKEEQCRWKKK